MQEQLDALIMRLSCIADAIDGDLSSPQLRQDLDDVICTLQHITEAS